MAAIASADLIADLERTVRARPARSAAMLSRAAGLLSVAQRERDARMAEAR